MMSSVEVRNALKSDKVTHRKQGRRECLKLIQQDSVSICASTKEWVEIAGAVMDCEFKEIARSQNTSKSPELETVTILKQVVKHCVKFVSMPSKLCAAIIQHSLTILYNSESPPLTAKYKAVHKLILIDMFDIRVVRHVDHPLARDIFQFLKESMTDKKHVIDPTNLRLLKCLCRGFYSDCCRSIVLQTECLEWFGSLVNAMAGDPTSQSVLAISLSECCSYILDSSGINNFEVLVVPLAIPLRLFIRQLSCSPSASALREHQREPLLRFFDLVMRLSITSHTCIHGAITSRNPLSSCLDALCCTMTDDDALRALVLGAAPYSQGGNRYAGVYADATEDPRVLLYLRVAAKACRLEQQLHQRPHGDGRRPGAVPPSPVMGTGMGIVELPLTSSVLALSMALKRPRHEGREMDNAPAPQTTKSVMSRVLERVACMANFRSPRATRGMNQTALTAWRHEKLSAEGLLLLLSCLCGSYPHGDFLDDMDFQPQTIFPHSSVSSSPRPPIIDGTPCSCPNEGTGARRCAVLATIVSTLREKLAFALDGGDDCQIQCSILIAMDGLARVADNILAIVVKDPLHEEAPARLDLRHQWMEAMEVLARSERVRKALSSCRNGSIADYVARVVTSVLGSQHILDGADCWRVHKSFWFVLPFRDPRLVESPAFFELFALLLRISNSEIPDSRADFCAEYFRELDEAEMDCRPDCLSTAVPAEHRPRNVREWVQEVPFTPQFQPFVYLACWLEFLFSSSNKTKLTAKIVVAHSIALTRVLDAMLGTVVVDDVNQAHHELDSDAALAHWFVFPDSEYDIESKDLPPPPMRLCGLREETETVRKASLLFDGVVATCISRLRMDAIAANSSEFGTSLEFSSLILGRVLIALHGGVNKCNGTVESREISSRILISFWALMKEMLQTYKMRIQFHREHSFLHLLEELLRTLPLQSASLAPLPDAVVHDMQVVTGLLYNIAEALRDGSKAESGGVDSNIVCDDSDLDNEDGTPFTMGDRDGANFDTPRTGISFNDDDDDDFAPSARGEGRASDRERLAFSGRTGKFQAKPRRVNLSVNQMKSISAVGKCLVHLCDDEDKESRLREFFQILKMRNQGPDAVELVMSSEVFLFVAEQLVSARPTLACKSFIMLSSWDTEYGCLGFAKVLSVLNQVTKDLRFFSDIRIGDHSAKSLFLEMAVDIIFATNDSIRNFPSYFWRIRCLQITCASNLCELGMARDPKIKSAVQALFVEGFSDNDGRVRLATARRLPLLFRLFQKHKRVYSALLEAASVPIVLSRSSQLSSNELLTMSPAKKRRETACPGHSEGIGSDGVHKIQHSVEDDPLLVVTTAIGIAHMGAESEELQHQAVYDLMRICCTRVSWAEWTAIDGSLITADADGEASGSAATVKTQSQWSQFFVDMLQLMATRKKYSTINALVLDDLRWILLHWMQPVDGSDPLDLRLFPFRLCFSIPYDRALDVLGHIIVPLICQVENQKKRWMLFLQFTADFGYGTTDSSVARVIGENLYAIRAIEMLIKSNERFGEAGSHDDCLQLSHSLNAFVARCLSPTLVQERSSSSVADAVKNVLLLTSYHPIGTIEISESDLSSSVDHAQILILSALESLGESMGIEPGGNSILRSSNLVDVLCVMRVRMMESRRLTTMMRLMGAVNVIIADAYSHGNWIISRAITQFLFTAATLGVACNGVMMRSICSSLQSLAEGLSKSLSSLTRTKGGSTTLIKITPMHCNFLGEFLVQCVGLHHGLMCRRIKDDGERDFATPNPNPHICDKFVEAQYFELVGANNRTTYDDVGGQSAGDLSQTVSMQFQSAALSIERAIGFILGIAHSCGVEDEICKYLPVSSGIDALLPPTLRDVLNENSPLAFNLTDQMNRLVVCITDYLIGDSIPLLCIWMKLEKLNEDLMSQHRATARNTEANKLTWGSDLVSREGAEVSVSLIAALIRLCDPNLHSHDSNCDFSLWKIIEVQIMDILGKIGPPDVLALNHDGLPSKPGNPLQSCESNLVKLKLNIMFKTYGLLSKSVHGSLVACDVLRLLHRNGSLVPLSKPINQSFTLKALFSEFEKESKLPSNAQYNACIDLNRQLKVSAWSVDAWDLAGKTYADWVCGLAACLVKTFYAGDLLREQISIGHSSGEMSDPKTSILGSDLFVASLGPLCAVEVEVAEAVLALVTHDLLQRYGQESEICDFLTQRFIVLLEQRTVYSTSSRVAELVCDVLVFVLHLDMQRFLRDWKLRPPSTSSLQKRWYMPYTFILKIDPIFVANAAVGCGHICTALLFFELAPKRATTAGAVAMSVGLESTEHPATDADAILLVDIFKHVHDPDAIFGVRQLTSNLRLQAAQYAQSGFWMEAMSTYECLMMQSAAEDRGRTYSKIPQHGSGQPGNREGGDSSARDSENPELRVAFALRGLGFENALSAWATRTSLTTHKCDEISRKFVYQGVVGLSSESDWRLASQGWTCALERAGDVADRELRQWPTAEEIRPQPPLADHQSILNPRSGKMRKSSVFTNAFSCLMKAEQTASEFLNYNISASIRSVQQGDTSSALHRARQCASILIPRLLKASSRESAVPIVTDLTRIQQLTEMREFADIASTPIYSSGGTASITNVKVDDMLCIWRERTRANTVRDLTPSSESVTALRLSLVEQLMISRKASPAQGCQLLEAVFDIIKSKNAAHALSPLIYKFHVELMESIRSSAGEVNMSSRLAQAHWNLLECKLLWKKGLCEAAQGTLDSQVIDRLRAIHERGFVSTELEIQCRMILAEALRTRGEWAITNRTASGAHIVTNFLVPASELATSDEDKIKAHMTLGNFYARLYQSTKAKIQSKEWAQASLVASDRVEENERCIQLLRNEKNKIVKGKELSEEMRALQRHMMVLRKEIELDNKERRLVLSSVDSYLKQAVAELVFVLKLSSDGDLECVFQLINLWFENHEKPSVNDFLNEMVDSIPSYKFVRLTHQIFSRLDLDAPCADDTSEVKQTFETHGFQKLLSRLMFKMAVDHPHHTLLQLFALSNAFLVGLDSYKSNMSRGRCEAAKDIVQRLKLHPNESLRNLVNATDGLLQAYISLANTNTEKFQRSGRTKNIGFNELVDKSARQDRRSCKSFHECLASLPASPCVVTHSPPLRKDCNYHDIVRISQFLPIFSITESGLSRPKIVDCEGTDGNRYRQLVKSGDDMRQDAVMEQVFEFVNHILQREEETRKRRLMVRTYKIVPTTPQTGVLEWVNDTLPFGTLLCDKEIGLHVRYSPEDWSHSACRDHLKAAAADDPNDKRIKLLEIYRNFQPVFRFFLLERFLDARKWMSRRLAYTHSVAAASIVGYILGIGDRHAHNILVDTTTAEVVHIDFGIVFEQGKGLGTPETVPFRLTRDIVDAMGVTGCEGTFRKSCEEVLRVMRENTLPLLTILEVVIHDPLYKWNLSPLQARRRQNEHDQGASLATTEVRGVKGGMDSGQGGGSGMGAGSLRQLKGGFGRDMAQRALTRIKAKLQGFEDPSGEGLSVDGQVDFLINEGRAPENLCKLFPGWAPWL